MSIALDYAEFIGGRSSCGRTPAKWCSLRSWVSGLKFTWQLRWAVAALVLN